MSNESENSHNLRNRKKRDPSDYPFQQAIRDFLFTPAPGTFFVQIPTVFYQMMSFDEIHVLAYLLNMHYVVMPDLTDDWFYCTSDRLEGHLGISRHVQHRILTQLIERGSIEMQKRGIPAKRYIRLKHKALLGDVIRQGVRMEERDMAVDDRYTSDELDRHVERQLKHFEKSAGVPVGSEW